MTKELKERIKNISDEWWKSSTLETFINTGQRLSHQYGIDDDEIINILTTLFGAMSSEFGG